MRWSTKAIPLWKDGRQRGSRKSSFPRSAAIPSWGSFPRSAGWCTPGRMLEFFAALLGGEVRAFDFVWMRVMGPGRSSAPHYDIVSVGRGTVNLYTSWTPLGDVTFSDGALMLLENSHRLEEVKATYGRMDVDKEATGKRPRGLRQGLRRDSEEPGIALADDGLPGRGSAGVQHVYHALLARQHLGPDPALFRHALPVGIRTVG